MKLTHTDFIEFVEAGAARITPADVQQLVSDLPEIRGEFRRLRDSATPEAERQLWFLSKVVERVWTDSYREMPYGAALEAAFAVAYFVRETDLIPDSLGKVGMLDDIAVIQTVISRHAPAYAAFRSATKLDWADFATRPSAPVAVHV